MLSRNITLSLLAVLLQTSIVESKKNESEGCLLDNVLIPLGNFKCTDQDGQSVTPSEEVVPSWTTCDVTCNKNDVTTYRVCSAGRWHGPKLNCQGINEHPNSLVPKKRMKRGFFKFLRCVFSFGIFCSSDSSRRVPPDRTPPSIVCPANIISINTPPQDSAWISYSLPAASDNKDGTIRPRLISGRPPEHWFDEGVTEVKYSVADSSGNSATCSFTVTVTVVRCPDIPVPHNGYFHCTPTIDLRYGVRCVYGCYKGYEPHGPTELNCIETGEWDNQSREDLCQKVECPLPDEILRAGNPNCTDGNRFQSQCTYTCNPGYDVRGGWSRVLSCNWTAEWTGRAPRCFDVERPTFGFCPASKTIYTSSSETDAAISWTDPEALDNSGNVRMTQDEGPAKDARVVPGTYRFSFTAIDSSHNVVRDKCRFTIRLIRLTCHTLYPTPDLTVTCPDGYGIGSSCTYSCAFGSILHGNPQTRCERLAGSAAAAVWDFGVQQPYCEGSPCSPLDAPKYGSLACDNWLYGRFCQMTCQDGYTLSPRMEAMVPNKGLYVCLNNGDWVVPTVPDCTKANTFTGASVSIKISYFSGDCMDESTKQQIAAAFVALLKTAELGFSAACNLYEDCKIINVKVKCGERSNSGRRKRSTATHESIISFDFNKGGAPEGDTQQQWFKSAETQLNDMADSVYSYISEGKLDLPELGMTADPNEFSRARVGVSCDEGLFPVEGTLECVGCDPGWHYDSDTGECQICPIGFYQELSRKSSCDQCLSGTSTVRNGSISSDLCIDVCQAGFISRTGLAPCTPCPLGTYCFESQGLECTACEPGFYTDREGSSHSNDCQAYDISFTASHGEAYAYINGSYGGSLQSMTLTFKILNNMQENVEDVSLFNLWLSVESAVNVPQVDETLAIASVKVVSGKLYGHYFGCSLDSMPSLDDGKWHSLMWSWAKADKSCVLHHGTYSVMSSESVLADTQSDAVTKMLNEGGVVNLMIGEIATDSKLFVGDVTDINVWSEELSTEVITTCAHTQHGDVISWADMPSALFLNAALTLPSQCDVTDDCASQPCGAHECVDELDSYTCFCSKGFNGTHCENNIDDCVEHECLNGASCVDGVAEYSCDCAPGYRGHYCEDPINNGGWSEWGDYTQCSVTCQGGTQTRVRMCNNPPPDSDGLPCMGPDYEIRQCGTQNCPVCMDLNAPAHASFDCTEESTGKVCSIHCEEGYDFGILPQNEYHCGPDSNYTWTFIGEDNPLGKLPECSATTAAKTLTVSVVMRYKNLLCLDDIKYMVLSRVRVILHSTVYSLECVRNGTCEVDKADVHGCDSPPAGKRRRREAEDDVVTLNVVLTGRETGDENAYLELVQTLAKAEQIINEQVTNGDFNVNILNTEYEVEGYDAKPDALCERGSIRSYFYCVECPAGTYETDDECIKCPQGSFQPKTSQTFCELCLYGKTTVGAGSISEEECNVECFDECPLVNMTIWSRENEGVIPTTSIPYETTEVEPLSAELKMALMIGGPLILVLILITLACVVYHQCKKAKRKIADQDTVLVTNTSIQDGRVLRRGHISGRTLSDSPPTEREYWPIHVHALGRPLSIEEDSMMLFEPYPHSQVIPQRIDENAMQHFRESIHLEGIPPGQRESFT